MHTHKIPTYLSLTFSYYNQLRVRGVKVNSIGTGFV